MNIIAVDDEIHSLTYFKREVAKINLELELNCFNSSFEALEYAKKNKIDVAFLDIEMPDVDGLTLAKNLKDIYSLTNIVFVTGYSDYMRNAFNMHASGYILKPVSKELIVGELENLRIPIKKPNEGIYIQCFGNFEIFIDEKPVLFKRNKSKEALAYLVDRKGAAVSKKELAAILLEDSIYNRSNQSYVHTIIAEMLKTLQDNKIENIIFKKRGYYYINSKIFSCDYYDYEKGDIKAINSYHGEYMTNYTWAEFTAGFLSSNFRNY